MELEGAVGGPKSFVGIAEKKTTAGWRIAPNAEPIGARHGPRALARQSSKSSAWYDFGVPPRAGAPLSLGEDDLRAHFFLLALPARQRPSRVGRRLQLPRRIYPRSGSAGRSCLSPTVYLPARSGRMTAYRRMNQKSGVVLSAFSLFNTWRFPNTYVGHAPFLFCNGRFQTISQLRREGRVPPSR